MLYSSVFAQPITIVVTSTPGGNVDLFARAVSKELNYIGYENVVINQAGANGDIAYNQVMSKPNNSIMVGALHNMMLSHVISNRENFHVKNMKIIGPLMEPPFAFVTGTKGFNSFNEMIQYAKKNPLPCGVPGSTGVELLKINNEYGTKFEPVQYRGTVQVKMDVLSNTLKCSFDGLGGYVQEQEAKTVKVLAATKPIIKGIIPIKSVLNNYKYEVWFGIAIPNNSKLIEDEKLMIVLTNITKNDRIIEFASTHTLFALTPEPDINNHIQQLTNRYKNLIK
jgi:hypothetical protein